ncbi:hypothetical protein [Clostridium butyricum]|uniref:hypothetical protein n=1 Tax=Clostridium butyricum TaxID=1492 RepID=UPI0021041D2C|nr:hypothetical protein [Clostridium butyricum]MCQ2013826.1 hypothetical protein [Clostridium butyricum]MCQ2024794.1 hypothetical protein [Clostridium butyricum]
MSKIMENLINNKFYETKKDVEGKLNVFFAFSVLTQEEYTKLMQLVEEKYKVTAIEDNKQEESTT